MIRCYQLSHQDDRHIRWHENSRVTTTGGEGNNVGLPHTLEVHGLLLLGAPSPLHQVLDGDPFELETGAYLAAVAATADLTRRQTMASSSWGRNVLVPGILP